MLNMIIDKPFHFQIRKIRNNRRSQNSSPRNAALGPFYTKEVWWFGKYFESMHNVTESYQFDAVDDQHEGYEETIEASNAD